MPDNPFPLTDISQHAPRGDDPARAAVLADLRSQLAAARTGHAPSACGSVSEVLAEMERPAPAAVPAAFVKPVPADVHAAPPALADQHQYLQAADSARRFADKVAAGVVLPTSPPDERIITCPVCGYEGVLVEMDPALGFKITHEGRVGACRAPLNPPGADDGELVAPVEISPN